MQQVQTALRPFDGLNRKTKLVAEGLTLEQIKDSLLPANMGDVTAFVTVNGEAIPERVWRHVRPKSCAVVGVVLVAAGGGDGKNPLATILMVATVIAAPMLGATYGFAAANAIYGTTATVLTTGQIAVGTALVTGAVTLVGQIAIAALSGAPSQRRSSNITESPTQYIEGASNAIDPWGVLPINLGVNRVFPKQAALPYTETVDNDEYARQLFTWGYGDNLEISDLKFGDTSVEEFDGLDMEHKLEGDLSDTTSLYTNDVFQETYSVLLSSEDSPTVRTTRPDCDEVILDVTFARGLATYDSAGVRKKRRVEFDLKYAPTGTTDWSAGSIGFKSIASQDKTFPVLSTGNQPKTVVYYIFINKFSGKLFSHTTTSSTSGWLICRTVLTYQYGGVVYSSITDMRDNVLFGVSFQNSSSFVPSISGNVVTVGSGGLRYNSFYAEDATAKSLRITQRVVFPERGQYDISIQRLTADSDDDKVLDEVYLTNVRSITFTPPVLQDHISGTAMRIKASDQLSGTVDKFNAILSTNIPDYDSESGTWVTRVTSNPASIYRYVLQAPAFVKRLPDDRIDIAALEEWHTYCESLGLEYNRYVDYDVNIETILNDVAAAGFATKYNVEGIYSVIVDNEKPYIKGLVTPRNSWGYSGSLTYPELPHALIVEFRNKDNGYEQDERFVYLNGYNDQNATIFERVQFASCTSSDLAYLYGRRYISNITAQPEVHSFFQDPEFLTLRRGDRFKFVNDVILVGVGSGRIKTLIYDNDTTPTTVTGFVLDDEVEIPSTSSFGVRMRYSDGSGFIYHALTTTIGTTNTFTFETPVTLTDYESTTDDYLQERQMLKALCAFTEYGEELDLLVLSVEADKDYNAKVQAINYAPERFDTDGQSIPVFQSHVTYPLSSYRPNSPRLRDEIISDESAMIRNSDGSITSRMIIPLINPNTSFNVKPVVRFRRVGASQWSVPDVITATQDQVILTNLQDGSFYDFDIYYRKTDERGLLSIPLQLRNTKFLGGSAAPSDVSNFTITVQDDSTAVLTWDKNEDVDISHYVLRYYSAYSGATWGNSQILKSVVYGNTLTIPFRGGTYLIKAVDLTGHESENAVTITSFDPGVLRNVVETLIEDGSFGGVKDNVEIDGSGNLILIDTSIDGYYYFTSTIDVGAVGVSFISSQIVASGQYVAGSGSNNIFNMDDIFEVSDLFGIGDVWSVTLQYRMTDDDPSGTPTWTDWAEVVVGNHNFRAVQFRLLMQSAGVNVSPAVSVLRATVDMPDRVERGEDLTVSTSGYSGTFSPAFQKTPAIAITIQDGETGDKIVSFSKSSSGFFFRVYNTVSASYVERTFDFIVSGYGRVI